MAYMLIYKNKTGIITTAFYENITDANDSYNRVKTAELYEKNEKGYTRIR